jgi:hypothetical protein
MPNSRQKERVPPERCSGFYSHTERAGNQRQPLGFQRKQLGPDMLSHHGTEQRMGVGIVNSNRQRLTYLSAVSIEYHNAVAHCSSGELQLQGFAIVGLLARLAGAFHEYGNFASEESMIVDLADDVLHREQFIIATFFYILGHVIGKKLGAFGAWALAVFEDEAVLEPLLVNELAGELEVLFRLATEANDEVARDGCLGNDHPNAIHHLEIFFDRVTPFHPFEHSVRTTLHGDMQVLGALGEIMHGLQQIVCHILRVVRDELDPLDAVDFMQRLEQIAEARHLAFFAVPITVDGLSEQDNFFAAFVGKLSGFGDDVLWRAALFWSTYARHDAISTELVATDHDPHIGLIWRGTHGRVAQGVETFVAPFDLLPRAVFATEADFHFLSATGFDVGDQIGNLMQLARADDQIDVRRTLENHPLIFLSHAAQDADDFVGILLLGILQTAERAINLVFGVLANTAGVEQDRVGVARIIGELKAAFAQAGNDKLAVEHVHLAAHCFDVQFLHLSGGFFFLGLLFLLLQIRHLFTNLAD